MTTPLPTRLAGSDLVVETDSLCKRYGTRDALRNLALQVPEGATYLLVGPNGAGKSTAIKTLLDLVRADSGSARVFGLDVLADGPKVRANIGYVPESSEWGYGWMRIGQLLEHQRAYFTAWDNDYATRLVRLFDIETDRRLDTLSKGQARRVHLVMALAHRPPLLLLDEPTDGLNPLMRDSTLGAIAHHLAESPTTVVISTHHVEEVERLADHIGVLRNGELRAQMPISEVQQQMRRFRLEVPEGWGGAPSLNGSVLHRVTTPREVQWIVWGDEAANTRALAASNASVRDVSPVSLIDATLALLQAETR